MLLRSKALNPRSILPYYQPKSAEHSIAVLDVRSAPVAGSSAPEILLSIIELLGNEVPDF